MDYRPMVRDEADAVLALVLRAFDAYVRPDLTAEGVATFRRFARAIVLESPVGHAVTIAEDGGAVVGMLDVQEHSHIALFFVDVERLGRGVGRGLFENVVARCRATRPDLTALTVNSSPWAVPVYRSLGFEPTDSEREKDGIRFTPMSRRF